MKINSIGFFALCFAAGANLAYATPITLSTNAFAYVEDKDFNGRLFARVLADTQAQAQFINQVLPGDNRQPTNYNGTVSMGGTAVDYHAEHGIIEWSVAGSGLTGNLDAISRIHQIELKQRPDSVVTVPIVIIVVIGVTCGYLQWTATNACIRACGISGVQSMTSTCGQSSSSAGCVCKPTVTPTPPSAPYYYGSGGYGSGEPSYGGYSYLDEVCDAGGAPTVGNCSEGDIVRGQDKSRALQPGLGWLTP